MESSRDIATLVVLFVSLYFEVFMLITYIEHRKTLKGRLSKPIADYSALPAVTIIVPCFNEEKTAGKTIESLLALDYPQDKLKIVAVNDGSSDGTAALLETYKITYPQIEIIHKENV
jgi:cellulose synthase/poly-beta-1,6-N-acetylglucosamine synthase-like glycosyltransferase